METPPLRRWLLHFDGACSPVNPGGHATYGWVLYGPDGNLVEAGKGYIGHGKGMTNNVAEWAALEAGLAYLLDQGITRAVTCRGDSRLVVQQVNGVWRCKKAHLQAYLDRVSILLEEFDSWLVEWVPREENAEADLLTQEALPPGVEPFRRTKVEFKGRRRKVGRPRRKGACTSR
jgi:ribonuclease HI